MSKEIRWGMIGCGNVTEEKSGAPALSVVDGARLTMVMSRNGNECADYAARHGVPAWTESAEELINSPDVDVVYIATPPDSHHIYAEMVAKAGKPIVSEKPLGRWLSEAEFMVECTQKAGVPLLCTYYRRELPRFLMVKKWIDDGVIGTPRFVHIQHSLRPESHPVAPVTGDMVMSGDIPWRFIPEVGGGGNFCDMGTHMLDMADYLLGPLIEVEGRAENKGGIYAAEDTVSASFLCEGGAHGTGQWCYVAGTNVDRMEIVGTEGAVRFSFFDEEPHELETKKDGLQIIEAKNPKHFHQPILQMCNDVLAGKREASSDWRNAIRAMRVQDKILGDFVSEFKKATSAV